MQLFSLDDIKHAISSPYFERGREYQRNQRVQAVHVDHQGNMINGMVQGGRPQPYHVVAYIKFRTDGVPFIRGMCNCPVSRNCKHVAALLLQYLAECKPSAQTAAISGASNAVNDAQLKEWLTGLEQALLPVPAPATGSMPVTQERLLYILKLDRRTAVPVLRVELLIARRLKPGGYGKTRTFRDSAILSCLTDADRRIIHWLSGPEILTGHGSNLHGKEGARLLHDMLATDACHWLDKDSPPLTLGEPRHAQLTWAMDGDGTQRLQGSGDGIDTLLPLTPPWFLDITQHQCGPALTGLPDTAAAALLSSPALAPHQATAARTAMVRRATEYALPLPHAFGKTQTKHIKPVPHLRLFGRSLPVYGKYRKHIGATEADTALARLSFDYDGEVIGLADQRGAITHIDGEQLLRIPRDAREEAHALKTLATWHFAPIVDSVLFDVPQDLSGDFSIGEDSDHDSALLAFSLKAVPLLREQGWHIEIDADYPFRVLDESLEWYAAVDETSGNDWFGLELGVLIDGQRVSLLPILLDLIRRFPQQMDLSQLKSAPPGHIVFARIDDGALLPMPVERLIPILETLTELYDTSTESYQSLRLPSVQAAQLTTLEASLGQQLSWTGGERLRELGRKLSDFRGVQAVAPPTGLRTNLRGYQQHGVDWLQFLREYQLGGLLADDMGLGKTVQTLAHLLLEKESGRMDRPCLVIAPTSLMVNWRMEAQRFAPSLRVLVLQGVTRKQHFEDMAGHDVVLTTYPLLPRDQEILLAQEYHLLILDEAQVIKNPKAKASQIVRKLHARHRLCLTGTPMENHLGELWSLLHFLMPGLLGDERRFRKLFRTPIEKHGDEQRRADLTRRIAPFLLRRSKQDVAKELPPKTVILRNVELGSAQRDLYESLRLAMHSKIQQEINMKGMARSHIIILDALLKLRQVCCDPRLVKLDSARRVKSSAKLELLMEMLPELVEEGRRILLFSQFTSMLALIEAELDKLRLPYVKLTGDTRDRATPVQRFQDGEIPLFLISLKAGGTGLNLTAADTVIHYDPWWNPAVETQATDRAHRLGQDKPVFVYKLLTAGTVEDKIQAMQARKKALADSLFNTSGKIGSALTLEDLNSLFEPLA